MDTSIELRNAPELLPLRPDRGEAIGREPHLRASVRAYNSAPQTISLQIRVQQLRQMQLATAHLSPVEARQLIEALEASISGATFGLGKYA